MPKELKAQIKLQIPAGAANPAPPVGSALGQHGVAIQDFCNQFNEKTKDKKGDIIPVIINVYEDRSFDFITKTPPTAELIKKELKLKKGSGTPNKDKVGEITQQQLENVAKIKMPDINANDIEAAKKIIAGSAKSMGLTIQE
jgi:large subunit ribosomal protein L11